MDGTELAGRARGPETREPRLRGGFRRADDDFLRELREYLQTRLRIISTCLLTVGALLLLLSGITGAAGAGWDGSVLLEARFLAHASAILVALGVTAVLHRKALTYRALVAIDAAIMLIAIAGATGVFALDYRADPHDVPAFLALFLVARSLVVPSTVRRTLLVCVWGLVGILLVQLLHGVTYDARGEVRPADTFFSRVLWNQVVLAFALGLAALASRLNFSLRVKAYEARRMDQYVIEGLIGEGAMGVVYRAQHALMRRPTALKLLRPERAGGRALRRFEMEVRQTCLLTHPNTVRIYDYGHTADGTFFYAMELLEGADLHEIVARTGPLPASRVVHVLRHACGALEEAHTRGLVHRDIKPGNLMLCRQGLDEDVVKVMDFGLVKQTAGDGHDLSVAGEICGTPLTISPESLRGKPVTLLADIYGLGAVGYILLTGQPVFDGSSALQVTLKHLEEDPVPPSARGWDVPPELEEILMCCLEKDPQARPQGAAELARRLAVCSGVGAWTQADATRWWAENRDRLGRSGGPAEEEAGEVRLSVTREIHGGPETSRAAGEPEDRSG
jgi:serine/threonine-protein kinase